MMRFLEYDFLKDHGLANFDNWVTVFGNQKTEWELAPAGNNITVKNGQVNFHKIISLYQLLRLYPCFYFARAFFLSVSDLSISL